MPESNLYFFLFYQYKRMKTQYLFVAFAFIFILSVSSFSQTPDIPNLIEETQKNSITTAKSHYFDFNSDWKRAVVKPNGKTDSQTYELVCSNKRCEHIQIESDGKNFSEKKIRKNREKPSKSLAKAETKVEKQTGKPRAQSGYSFATATVFSDKTASYLSPYVYLKNCKTDFLEKQSIENRPTIKLRAYDCNINDEPEKEAFLFMQQTEAAIWIDEADKAVAKIEIYGKRKTEDSINSSKPLIIMETAKVSQGGWFWKKIIINANGNSYFFPADYGNWQIDFFNYKKFNVDIDKAEVDGKSN